MRGKHVMKNVVGNTYGSHCSVGSQMGEIKHLRLISMSEWGDEDIIAALLFEPDNEQMVILELLSEHDTTRYYRTDVDEFHLDPVNMRKRVLEAIDAAIRKWSKRKPMDMVRMLAEEYGVEA